MPNTSDVSVTSLDAAGSTSRADNTGFRNPRPSAVQKDDGLDGCDVLWKRGLGIVGFEFTRDVSGRGREGIPNWPRVILWSRFYRGGGAIPIRGVVKRIGKVAGPGGVITVSQALSCGTLGLLVTQRLGIFYVGSDSLLFGTLLEMIGGSAPGPGQSASFSLLSHLFLLSEKEDGVVLVYDNLELHFDAGKDPGSRTTSTVYSISLNCYVSPNLQSSYFFPTRTPLRLLLEAVWVGGPRVLLDFIEGTPFLFAFDAASDDDSTLPAGEGYFTGVFGDVQDFPSASVRALLHDHASTLVLGGTHIAVFAIYQCNDCKPIYCLLSSGALRSIVDW